MGTTGTTSAARTTILVVEDGREVLDVLERTLRENGFNVLTATDGETGLQLALDVRPDLIVLDIEIGRASCRERV